MFNPDVLHIAVALVHEDDRLALAWNTRWQAFNFPMTKVPHDAWDDSIMQAAVRAAAEEFQVPCRPCDGAKPLEMRRLQLSSRDDSIKDYHLHLVEIEVHPDFQNHPNTSRRIMAKVDDLQLRQFGPLSPTVEPIIQHCIMTGLVPTPALA